MELKFIKVDGSWVAEFSTTDKFNLHIEDVKQSDIKLYQSTVEGGKFSFVASSIKGISPYSLVYDRDITGTIYPKYIRVECATEPTMAEVTSEGEVIQIEIPVEPEEPESDVIEYHFEFNDLSENYDIVGEVAYDETQHGDFSDMYNKIYSFVKDNGVVSDLIIECGDDILSSATNITFNGYRVNYAQIEMYGDEPYRIVLDTDGPTNSGWNTTAYLLPSSIYYCSPTTAHAPSSDVIEYHFEIPMEGSFNKEGEIEGDFSELYNKLVSFAKEYGTENENGEWYVPNETVDKKINITVNEDKVTSLEFYSQYNEVNCSTTKDTATFKLYENSAYYEIQGF